MGGKIACTCNVLHMVCYCRVERKQLEMKGEKEKRESRIRLLTVLQMMDQSQGYHVRLTIHRIKHLLKVY